MLAGEMSNTRNTPSVDRSTVLIAAAKIGCDPRTAQNIIARGPAAARHLVHRERAAAVLAELGIATASTTSTPPRAA